MDQSRKQASGSALAQGLGQAEKPRKNGRACTNCRDRKPKKLRTAATQPPDVALVNFANLNTTNEDQDFSSTISRETPELGTQSEENGQLARGNIADFLDQEELRTGEIDHIGRNLFIGTEVSNFNYLVRQGSSNARYDHCFHFTNRQFHPKYTSFDSDALPEEALKLPSKALADRLLHAYFVHVNRGWPIVDEDLSMARYRNHDPQNPLALSLLNAMMLVGAHVLSANDEDMKGLKSVFYRRAKLLIDHRIDQDRTAYIQTAILMTWHSDGLEDLMANAWYWIGTACRVAYGLGIHRDCTPSILYDVHKRTWIRLWWILFQFDTILSTALGRPQAINIEESDVPELETTHFEGIPKAEVNFVIHHTRLCKIISEVTKQRWALRASFEAQADATRAADEKLAHFLTHLPLDLRPSSPARSVWQATLSFTYNNFALLLHRPPPKIGLHGPTTGSISSAAICSDAALSITSRMEEVKSMESTSHVWGMSIYALFTAIVYASTSLGTENSLITAKSVSMFESLFTSLHDLSYYWQLALSLRSLYEQRLRKIKRQKQQLNTRAVAHGSASIHSGDPVSLDTRAVDGADQGQEVANAPDTHPLCESYFGDFGEETDFLLNDILLENLMFHDNSSIGNLIDL
ncbi:hypothetical protein BU24DRAFT_454667 [Aaosphaeria arxii CBS 175.79]|uniref:Xylanolytic transcriptional activator regulatory domain-containing protein n=1 Tax=Aaosphaeria arxii CBS 175.79 TaxID=1450172 RepID=A0A6A5XE81_9PLEO|nr:uncharacterized protein BU24DRAFT_454667 [Aaosphaeria arxii CBS 175.79]KAF2011193.1 hypothetical protein BU24DRAFT_454667 [Aaosphaeria arxii CBS 175.79]